MRFELARPFSAARRRAIKFSRTWSGKMPLPDTRMSAPASATTGAVSTLIPPSTWISTARCSWSTYFRAARIFGKTSARNACPENPGWTVMTSSRSTSPRYGTLFSNGVAGFRTTPGLTPASRIARIVAGTSWSLSRWTVRSSTPASANGFTNSCGCVTIRWASSGTWVSGRIDFTMAGPIVRLGTKWPSITSMWSMSAPASAASRTWSPKRSNRADKIDGAILMAIGLRNERAWNKISLPQGVRRREGTRYSARLGSMERREFGDDLHSANEGDRLHDVSDIATEPCFRRETRLPALIASEAHDRSFAIVRREAVDRREGHADRDRRERPRGRRHVLQLTRVEHQPDRHRHVETVPEPEGIVRCVEAPRDHRMDRRVARHVPSLVLLDREGPDVKGGLVRCLDGRNVRDIEPTAGGPKRALQLDGADLLQLREIGGAIHGIPVDRRVLHHRPKQEQGRGIRLVPISDRVENAPEVERAMDGHIVLRAAGGRDRAGQRSREGRASPRRPGDEDVGRGRVDVVRPRISDVPRRNADRRGLRRVRARWRA